MTRVAEKRRVQAIVFDWAGTMVDFGCLAPVNAFQRVFARHGVTVTTTDVRRFMGYDKRRHLRLLCDLPHVRRQWQRSQQPLTDPATIQQLYLELEEALKEAVVLHAQPVPGVVKLVERLRERGIRIGSTTGYTRSIMERLAPSARVHGYAPETWVASDEVPEGRPAPFMCYLNAVRLGIYPLECMVKVGDTAVDMAEGGNAGMWTVGVAISSSDLGLTESEVESMPLAELERRIGVVQESQRKAGAHYVVKTLDELEQVLELVDQALAKGKSPQQTTGGQG